MEVRCVEHPVRVDWNAQLVTGELGKAVQQLKRESGKGLFVAGVKLLQALAELGLIDEYEFVVHPRLAGHGPTLFAGFGSAVTATLCFKRTVTATLARSDRFQKAGRDRRTPAHRAGGRLPGGGVP